jgi:predicted nuclease of predicted toxin-antitoxin system
VKLLIDQNRSPRLASLLRDRGRDAVRTLELGSERAEDDAL